MMTVFHILLVLILADGTGEFYPNFNLRNEEFTKSDLSEVCDVSDLEAHSRKSYI